MTLKIVTTGVYGFTADTFFASLQAANVDAFCDVRQRRGVRGKTYAFANSRRLQERLAELGINYLHRKDLAPTKAIRQRQQEADEAAGVAKRQRTTLGAAFRDAYQREILDHFDPQSLLDDLASDAQVVALCCVERQPAACHRSLIADKLERELNVDVEHLLP